MKRYFNIGHIIWLPVAAVLAVACGDSRGEIRVQAVLSQRPVAGLEITAVPFDPDLVLDSLAQAAPTPKPTFPDLERELAEFVPRDVERFSAVDAPWKQLKDSVVELADSLSRMDRRSAEYASLYDRFRSLYERLAKRSADRERAVRELTGTDRELAERARAAAESLRVWEEIAYAHYPAAAAGLQLRAGRQTRSFTTDSTGNAHAVLETGDWWLVARIPDASNPFEEYRWNVAVRLTGWLPLKVPFFEGNSERRWRH